MPERPIHFDQAPSGLSIAARYSAQPFFPIGADGPDWDCSRFSVGIPQCLSEPRSGPLVYISGAEIHMAKHYRGNSALRRQRQDRQDSNRYAIAGVLFALMFLASLFFGGESKDTMEVVGPDRTPAEESNPLVDYATGAKTKAMLQELED